MHSSLAAGCGTRRGELWWQNYQGEGYLRKHIHAQRGEIIQYDTILTPIPMYGEGGFPTAPMGCPPIQLNSDNICLEMASGPTGWGLNLTRPPPAKGQSQTQIITHAPDCPVTDLRFQWPPPGFDEFARKSHRTQSNTLCTRLLVYYKRL